MLRLVVAFVAVAPLTGWLVARGASHDGVRTEVPRAIAAKLLAELRARVATAEQAREFHEAQRSARDAHEQSEAAKPRVCFVPTASGDAAGYVESFYRTFSESNCQASHLPFFDRTPDLPSLILNQDLIFVGGGNTKTNGELFWPSATVPDSV